MRVDLVDLGQNQVTPRSDVYPLGVANLVAYAKAHADLPLDLRLFRELQDLKAALDERPPDVPGPRLKVRIGPAL